MRRTVHPMHLVAGLTLWFAWLMAIYTLLSVGCAVAPPPLEAGPLTWINAAISLLAVVVVLLLAHLALWCARGAPRTDEGPRPARFLALVSASAYLVAMIATVVVGLPTILLPPCI